MSDMLDENGDLVFASFDIKRLAEDETYRAACKVSIDHLRYLADRGLIPPWYVENDVIIAFNPTPAESARPERTEPLIWCSHCGLEAEWDPVYQYGIRHPVDTRSKCCGARPRDAGPEHPYR